MELSGLNKPTVPLSTCSAFREGQPSEEQTDIIASSSNDNRVYSAGANFRQAKQCEDCQASQNPSSGTPALTVPH